MRIAILALAAAMTVSGLTVPALLDAEDHGLPARFEVAIPAATESEAASAFTAVRSDLEDAYGISYQHDGGVEGDAPDTCETVDPARRLITDDDESMMAMLLENDDEADAFAVPIGVEYVGKTLVYDLTASIGADLDDLKFDIRDATCGQSVFDPEADMYNPTRTTPGASDPFDPQAGAETYDLPLTDGYGCGGEWKFQMKHKEGALPSALYVEWSNGDYTYVENDDDDPSQVAKYTTTYNTQHTLSRIMTQMPAEWDGELSILTGICDAEEWHVDAPIYEKGEFTVVKEGQYVLLVTIENGAVDKLSGGSRAMDGCHDTGFCLIAFEQVSYESTLMTKSPSATA